jgi:NhaP-type Na+/H+ and K+/H+ antiporter
MRAFSDRSIGDEAGPFAIFYTLEGERILPDSKFTFRAHVSQRIIAWMQMEDTEERLLCIGGKIDPTTDHLVEEKDGKESVYSFLVGFVFDVSKIVKAAHAKYNPRDEDKHEMDLEVQDLMYHMENAKPVALQNVDFETWSYSMTLIKTRVTEDEVIEFSAAVEDD